MSSSWRRVVKDGATQNQEGFMKTLVGFALLCGVLGIQGQAQAKPASQLTSAADLKWVDVPGFAGLQMAVADGDPAKGPSHFFIKFPPGFAAPEHLHTADHFVAVIAGTVTLGVDGKESKLGPGSYFSFKGKQKHTTKCEMGADCVVTVDARGKWDVKPTDAKAAADAKGPAPTK
jgi:quercetin dioxygenase-like cupin family protein